MKKKILFIERKYWGYVSIEKVFEQVAKNLPEKKFATKFVKMPFDSDFWGILKNLFLFRRPPADIYHITGQVHFIALALPAKNTVLTIHDLNFLHNKKGLRRFVLKKLFLDWPVRKLRYVTAISEATKKEIIASTNCPPGKIRLIENPLPEIFLTAEKKPFGKERPIVLQVGTFPNKNVFNLVRALRGVNCRLRLIGKLEPELLEELQASRIDFEDAYGLGEEEMKAEYENADIVAFCSLYEGFGMPIIEAQAAGTPLITSNLSPMKDVAGAGACLADPFDPESIREGILRIIGDDSFRQKIVAAGRENIRRFDPKAIGRRYEELYDEILREWD